MIKREVSCILLVVIAGSLFAAPSGAKIGYDIVARVGQSEWEIHRSTQEMKFEFSGNTSGSGNFSKYININGLGGIEAKERSSSSQPGELSYEEAIRAISKEGPVVITLKLKSGTNESVNESILVNESAQIDVDERWPTAFINYKKLSYSGSGIRTFEDYQNNGDIVATFIDAWTLSKESLYEAHINRTIISVNITPNDVVEERFANKSSRYRLNMDSVGKLTHLKVVQRAPDGYSASAGISQNYIGAVKMGLDVKMTGWVPPEKEEIDWLGCCYPREEVICDRSPSIQNFFS